MLWKIREVFILRELVTFPFLNSKVRRRKWKEPLKSPECRKGTLVLSHLGYGYWEERCWSDRYGLSWVFREERKGNPPLCDCLDTSTSQRRMGECGQVFMQQTSPECHVYTQVPGWTHVKLMAWAGSLPAVRYVETGRRTSGRSEADGDTW